MKQTGYNPYLPGWEYVPDGEPRVFGDRVYIFGSHDKFGGERFCENDYICWSAPVDKPTEWMYEGIIYERTQDPDNKDGKLELWAPDIAQGPDGRYYLYYCLAIYPRIGVAVCDTPAGKYEFYGHVRYKNGECVGARRGEQTPFDPGIFVDEDGSIHLYSGQSPMEVQLEPEPEDAPFIHKYTYHMQLEEDMLTVKTEPKPLLPSVNDSAGTGFEGHEFFEASSMRKYNGKYYIIYSSVRSHELCYAVSDYPDRDFAYGGTLVSIGDIGLHEDVLMSRDGKPTRIAKNYLGNTHGSIEKIGEDYYVFYHRQTNRTSHTRQGAVEKIAMNPDGSFSQVEMTSGGFYGLLPGTGDYEARIACNLWSKEGCVISDESTVRMMEHPAFTQDEPDGLEGTQYISNMKDGATAGFKYFDLSNTKTISVMVRGEGNGCMVVRNGEEGEVIAKIMVIASKDWANFSGELKTAGLKKTGLFFTYEGTGAIDFLSFILG